MKKINIKNLFVNKILYLFDEKSYQLGLEYNNIEKLKVLHKITFLEEISPRKCKVKLENEMICTMYFYESGIKFSIDNKYVNIHNIISTDNYSEAIKIMYARGYSEIIG